jgi:cytochrome d ubiquinol oxidase subunit I
VLFTLLGFAGIYLALGLLFVVLVVQETVRGPSAGAASPGDAESLSFY